MEVTHNGFKWKQENGKWKFEPISLKIKKPKRTYSEPPPYPVVEDIEDSYHNGMHSVLKSIAKGTIKIIAEKL